MRKRGRDGGEKRYKERERDLGGHDVKERSRLR